MKNELKDKIDILNKKIQNLQAESNKHDLEIRTLRESFMNGDGNANDNEDLALRIEELEKNLGNLHNNVEDN